MSVVSALVLFAVVWFLVLFVVLPIRLETQGDVGERVEGTHSGAPSSSFSMKRKLRIATYWAGTGLGCNFVGHSLGRYFGTRHRHVQSHGQRGCGRVKPRLCLALGSGFSKG